MAKVLVKAPALAKLFGDLSKKVQAGKITIGESRKHLEDAEADGLLAAPQGPKTYEDQRGRKRFTLSDPDDADRVTGRERVNPKAQLRAVLSKAIDADVSRLDEVPEFAGKADDALAAKIKMFQRLNDGLLFASAMLHGDDGSPFQPRHSKYYAPLQSLAQEIASKILTSTGVGTGAEWVPTALSGQMVEIYRTQLRLAGMVEHFTIPRGSGSLSLPLEGADVVPYLAAGASDDDPATSANAIKARTPATSNVTFTGVGMKVRLLVNSEATEDSVIDMVDYLRRKGVWAMLQGTEGCMINGDTAGTHQDSDVTASDDYRKAWNGLRKLINAEASLALTTADAGKLRALHFVNLRTRFGKYGDDPSRLVNVVSSVGAAHLTADANFVTLDKMGPNASLLTGQVGAVLGSPVVVSSHIRNNLNNAGKYDGTTTTKTIAMTFHRDCFALADKRQITVEAEKDIQTDKWIVVVTKRDDFKRIQPEASLERNVGQLVGINTLATF